ncbi:lytic transglycosylase domain-containing protein [Variovorax sp. PAMC 28711]|uniref:lytic transglycosylase domain-containing protein n=1 Tax=Variovorax sp. PAMC 28711 TaxID=1795631 RepID=UPI00078BAC87|nr:lytic transglycosylase domain-containing protein [Variovorax sp. PAMC 28711]AMM23290.1 lytic transglycosylase [Variovorax sp. PAMC 28711]
MSSCRALMLGLLLLLLQPVVHAADIYGYVDERGTAHFAAEKLDARYQLFFRGGQSFDTAEGLGRPGAPVAGKVPPASQTLVALFEASPSYKTVKAALREAAQRHAIDYELLQALVAAESGFDAQAVSPKGAIGLMQLMPATAQRYGVQADKKATIEKKLFDPRVNIAAGTRYLRDLIALFQGDLELAVAAYNAGEGAVQRAGNKIPNYKETQNYVKTVLQLYAYLKPGGGGVAKGGGKAPGRVKMEIGGALGRGNMPPSQPVQMPELSSPLLTTPPPTSPYMPAAPATDN